MIIHKENPHYLHQDHFKGLGAEYIRVNGQKVWEVSTAMESSKKIALTGQPVVMHLDVLRRHGHSGPLKENSTSEYRLDFDTIEHREKNDCIKLACEYANLNGYDKSQLENQLKQLIVK